jgi:hypothetical protein
LSFRKSTCIAIFQTSVQRDNRAVVKSVPCSSVCQATQSLLEDCGWI